MLWQSSVVPCMCGAYVVACMCAAYVSASYAASQGEAMGCTVVLACRMCVSGNLRAVWYGMLCAACAEKYIVL